ncbi:MAG: methyltransferase [Sphingobacteriales bacterium]|nr:methyltransferase [Sphingobacteriales bacterium]
MSSTKSNIFHFKQFAVDQSSCAMKVNTDGVLLGALASHSNPHFILDIGTGTGVIAMMLAQRFTHAKVDAIEIDVDAAQTASLNFNNSPFKERLTVYADSFQQHLDENNDQKYDLIVSNPPFFIDSLKSNSATKTLARHTDKHFFERFLQLSSAHLNREGFIELILPIESASMVKELSGDFDLFLQKQISIQSFGDSIPHRELLTFGFEQEVVFNKTVVIYNKLKEYSMDYKNLLKSFLTIF